MRNEDLAFYTAQSPVTDPGRMSAWLGGLPSDIAALQRLARVLVIHYRADSPLEEGIAPERLAEIDTRYAEAMFSRLAELREGPFGAGPRQPAERLVGCCRDFTILFVSLARAAGVPARARVGFAPYFIAGFNLDHEVAEVWDAATGRWRLVDAQLGDDHRDPNDGERIDPLDVGGTGSSSPGRPGGAAVAARLTRRGSWSVRTSTSPEPGAGLTSPTTSSRTSPT